MVDNTGVVLDRLVLVGVEDAIEVEARVYQGLLIYYLDHLILVRQEQEVKHG